MQHKWEKTCQKLHKMEENGEVVSRAVDCLWMELTAMQMAGVDNSRLNAHAQIIEDKLRRG